MNKYLITLKPLGCFYFGGERSFNDKDQGSNESASYIVESNYFPQQTALLGMLRFWLLRNDEDLFNNSNQKIRSGKRDDLVNKIGKQSFRLNGGEEQKFGIIKSIGSCFICNNDREFILPMPFDIGLNIDFTKCFDGWYGDKKITLPCITYKAMSGVYKDKLSGKQYSCKDSVWKYLYDNKNSKVISYNTVFKEDRRVGINRSIATGRVSEDNLYKQIFYRMTDDYQFGFMAEFTKELGQTLNNQIVELGGDNSKFLLTFKDISKSDDSNGFEESQLKYNGLDAANGDKYKAVLLCDAMIDRNHEACFTISGNTPMRFLHTNIDTSDYSKLRSKCVEKSERFSLISRGSVFYFNTQKDRNSFVEHIESNKDMVMIGYNNVQIID